MFGSSSTSTASSSQHEDKRYRRSYDESPSWDMVDFMIASLGSEGKTLDVEALVLTKITSVLPSHPIHFNRKWKQLMDISLADTKFSKPGNIDLLLGADVFRHGVLHGSWFGHSWTPSPFETCFEWVLACVVHKRQQQYQTRTCCYSNTMVDDLLKRFWEIENYNLQQPVLSLDEQTMVEHF